MMKMRYLIPAGAVAAAAVSLCISACSQADPGGGSGAASAPRKALDRNTDCGMCHMNFLDEPLSVEHARHGIACADCHGPSQAHTTDERFETPPDRVFAPGEVDGYCRKCHSGRHKAEPARLIERWLEAAGTGVVSDKDESPGRCTACHGKHRIATAGAGAGS